jgi:hypothetical protein
MEELIYFTIPGAVLAVAIVAVYPPALGNGSIWIVLIPLMGFIIHETWRLIFDYSGGLPIPWHSTGPKNHSTSKRPS